MPSLPPSTLTPANTPDVNRGPNFLAALWTTTMIALIVVIARMYVRLKVLDYHGWDDYTIVFAMVLGIVGVCIDTVAVSHGLGRHEIYLSATQIVLATKYNFLAIPFNLMSSAFAKVSVAFFLIHVNANTKKKWSYFLLAMMVLLVLFATATIAVLFGQCTPASALWTHKGKCLPPTVNTDVGLAQSVFFAVADFTFAIFPLTFLWHLQMNMRTKLALGGVLSLGVLAAAFGIVRCVMLQELATRQDILFGTIGLGIWSFMEQNICIIAACIPPLYAVFRKALGNATIYGSGKASKKRGYADISENSNTNNSRRNAPQDPGYDMVSYSKDGSKMDHSKGSVYGDSEAGFTEAAETESNGSGAKQDPTTALPGVTRPAPSSANGIRRTTQVSVSIAQSQRDQLAFERELFS